MPDEESNDSCTINASGTYHTTLVCGTGSADGTATVTEGGGSDSYTITFHIMFSGGQGTLTGSATESGDASESDPNVTGTVSIVPTVGHGDCVTQPVDQFTVTGTVASTI